MSIRDYLWKKPQQAITSAGTCIHPRTAPSVFKKVEKQHGWTPGTRNADVGGGRYDNATAFLKERDIDNCIWDPFNRDELHNQNNQAKIERHQCHTATCSNVLNVVKEPENRDMIIAEMAAAIKPEGKAFFTVYEGNKSGKSCATSKGWQEHRRTRTYAEEIGKWFRNVTVHNDVITATNPRSPYAMQEAA